MGVALNIQTNYIELQNWLEKAKSIYSSAGCPHERVDDGILKIAMQVAAIRKTKPDMLHVFLQELITEFKGYKLIQCRFNKSNYEHFVSKRAARTVLTGMCYSVGSATRQGSSSLTRFIGQSAITSSTWRR